MTTPNIPPRVQDDATTRDASTWPRHKRKRRRRRPVADPTTTTTGESR